MRAERQKKRAEDAMLLAGFERGGRGHEARNLGGSKAGKIRKQMSPSSL